MAAFYIHVCIHYFNPSTKQTNRIRREVQFIQPAAVLALTATATPRIQVIFLFTV